MQDHTPPRKADPEVGGQLIQVREVLDGVTIDVRITPPIPAADGSVNYGFVAVAEAAGRRWQVDSQLSGKRRGKFVLKSAALQLARQLRAQIDAEETA
ncbi:hypothetical protein SEA_YAGO84_54 [Gordonia phage Yago84]|nr:hypothetical protein SEA_YAGO84_54 [Gordonia phage Yago84]QIG58982.1 hypothetical protein SEA_ANCLAR_55 [Gordonia phage AnClar]